MSRRTADRPLTDAEERTLVELSEARDNVRGTPYTKPHPQARPEWEWIRPHACRNSTTLYALADRGLVTTRERPMTTVARITDEGYALVSSMGD